MQDELFFPPILQMPVKFIINIDRNIKAFKNYTGKKNITNCNNFIHKAKLHEYHNYKILALLGFFFQIFNNLKVT